MSLSIIATFSTTSLFEARHIVFFFSRFKKWTIFHHLLFWKFPYYSIIIDIQGKINMTKECKDQFLIFHKTLEIKISKEQTLSRLLFC